MYAFFTILSKAMWPMARLSIPQTSLATKAALPRGIVPPICFKAIVGYASYFLG
jgi:hypothetical protein